MMKKQNKIYLAIGIVAVVLIAAIAMFSMPKGDETIKIGVITPLTGFTAESGQNVKKGLELGKEFVKNRDNIIIDFIYEDGQCSGTQALNAYNKLKLESDMKIITGFVCSSEVLPIAPLLKNSDIYLVPTTASSPLISNASDKIFRVAPNDKEDALLHFNYIKNNYDTSKKVGIVYIQNDYGDAIQNILVENLRKADYTTYVESFNFGESDYRTTLSKLKNENVSIISLIGYPENSILFLKQIQEFKMSNVKVLGSWATLADEFFQPSNQYLLNNFLVTEFGQDSSSFKNLYVNKYNEEPVVYSDFAFDSVLVIADLIKSGKIYVDSFNELNISDGATGGISFDENGDRVGLKASLYKVENQSLKCDYGC